MLHLSPLSSDTLLMPPRGARRSCLSSSSRAMTRCLPSAGRGLSTTLVFGVAQTLLAFLRDLREPEDFRPVGMHRIAPCRMWEWYCQVVSSRKWCCASREVSVLLTILYDKSRLPIKSRHEKTRLTAERPPLIPHQRGDGGYGCITNDRERRWLH